MPLLWVLRDVLGMAGTWRRSMAALYNQITVTDGAVEQGNFDTYRALRINEAPRT